jgi:5-methylcytosine-specific restriction endonuclease McrA
MVVYVLNSAGVPLMPCSASKARRLLDEGQAKVVSRTPFVIKLLYGSSGYKQPITLSIDSGSKMIGVAAVGNGKTLYASEVKTRGDIHEKMSQRATYRRTRRTRKLRYRKPRWANRKRNEGWLTPTMRSKVQSHLLEIEFVKRILSITRTVVETASFDIHKIVNPDVTGKEYQEGRQKDFYNLKQYILSRDGYLCQKCSGKKKDDKLHVHHIIFRCNGGTHAPENLITLCKTCHDNLHLHENAAKESLKLQKKRRPNTIDAVQVSTISSTLKKNLAFEETFGYETKFKRETLGLPKEHYIDAICVGLSEDEVPKLPDAIYKKACIPLGDYKQTAGSHSEKSMPTGKIMGIRKFDKVEWLGQELFVKGRMSTGYAVLMDIHGNTVPVKPMAKMKGIERISARKSCLTIQIATENFLSNTTSFSSANIENPFSKNREYVNI